VSEKLCIRFRRNRPYHDERQAERERRAPESNYAVWRREVPAFFGIQSSLIPANLAASSSNVTVSPQPAAAPDRSMRQSAKSALKWLKRSRAEATAV
jgi:hypothetical protein